MGKGCEGRRQHGAFGGRHFMPAVREYIGAQGGAGGAKLGCGLGKGRDGDPGIGVAAR